MPILTPFPQVGDDLNPIRALALLSAISDEDAELLDLAGRPENLIMTHLPVPPVCIRPSVELEAGGGTNEDDITMKLMVRGPGLATAPAVGTAPVLAAYACSGSAPAAGRPL